MNQTFKQLTYIAFLSIAVCAPAQAQSPGGTLAKIRDTGEIRLGHRDVSVPFSYLDDNQKSVGFAMDLCARIVDAVKDELKLPALQTKLQPIQINFNAVSNTFTVSGLSFQPKVLFLWHNWQDDATDTLTSTDHRRGWGFAAGTSARGCIGTIARDASAASNTGVAQRNDGVMCVPTDAGAIDGVIDLSAFNSDGFTLIVDDATAAALALDVEWVAWGGSDITNATSAQIQTPAAAGNWDTTTVGFQPTFLALLGTAVTSAPPAANVDTRMCFGCTDN